MKLSDLRPCPFCGGHKLTVNKTERVASVICLKCGAEGPVRRFKTRAKDSWEKRV